jgi:hypothetical protein
LLAGDSSEGIAAFTGFHPLLRPVQLVADGTL